MNKKIIIIVGLLASLFIVNFAKAERVEYEIVIKDHKFIPDILEVEAGKKLKIVISNQDATPEEFESHDLNREKIIQGNSQGVILLNPLKPGEYAFFGEFNEDTAQGKLIAK